MKDKAKAVLVYGKSDFSDRYTVQEILQERVRPFDIVYTFRQDGACHLAETWARSRRIPCYTLSLMPSGTRRQVQLLELVSLSEDVILFGGDTDITTNYIFRLAKRAKRTIYCVGFTKIPELLETERNE